MDLPPGATTSSPERGSARTIGQKQATYIQRFIRALENLLFMVNRKLFSIPKARLVETVQVGEMDSKPHKATFAQWFLDPECEQASCEIVTDRVEMRRYRVGPASEVEVVGNVEYVVEILRGVSGAHSSSTGDSPNAQSPDYS